MGWIFKKRFRASGGGILHHLDKGVGKEVHPVGLSRYKAAKP